MGCIPFRMSEPAYLAALTAAAAQGIALPQDFAPVPPTAWDSGLAHTFAARRLVVHEERVMDEILDAHAVECW